MLVLHPSTITEMDGKPPGTAVVGVAGVLVGVSDGNPVGVFVLLGNEVLVAVEVAITGVAEALVTPMMTGVAVKMDGVLVDGRKGVGGLYGRGCTTQPLQDDNNGMTRIKGIIFFISSPHRHFIPLDEMSKAPIWH